MKDTVQRVRYRERQVLRAADLTAEQDFRIAMRRRHNIGHHQWGIVTGLSLVASATDRLWVQPGLAVDGYGRELIVPEPMSVPADVFERWQSEAVDLWLLFNRIAETPPPRGRWQCGPGQHSRWHEKIRLCLAAVDDERNVNPRFPVDVSEKDLDFGPHQLPPDDPRRQWPVYLGRISYALLFRMSDLQDPTGLVAKLKDTANAVSQYLRERFSDDFRTRLDEDEGADPPSDELQKALVKELNRLLQGDSLYDEVAFPSGKRRKATRRLAAQDPSGSDLVHLNRLLLEDAYPQELKALVLFRAWDLRDPVALATKLCDTQSALSCHLVQALALFRDQDLKEPDGLVAKLGNTQDTLCQHLLIVLLLFQPTDLTDVQRLIVKLQAAEGPRPLSDHLRERFSDDFRTRLDEYEGADPPSDELQKALVKELNRLLRGDSLYDEQAFTAVELRPETAELIEKEDLQRSELVHLNRLLLEDAFPDEIRPLSLYRFDLASPSPTEWVRALLEKLNRLLFADFLYDEQVFDGVDLRPETEVLIEKEDLQRSELVHLNRLLLEDAFPDEIRPLSLYRFDLAGPSPTEWVRALLEELNRLLFADSLYDEQVFDGVDLRPETAELIEKEDLQRSELVYLNRLLLEDAFPHALSAYPPTYVIDLENRPYVRLVGEGITSPSGRARMQVGSQTAEHRHPFALMWPDPKKDDENQAQESQSGETESEGSEVWKDRLTIDRFGNMTIRGNTSLEQDVVFAHPDALLQVEDLKAPPGLVVKLRDTPDALSQYLREGLSPGAQRLIDAYDGSSLPSAELLRVLVKDLNALIQHEFLYDEQRFDHVVLRERTRARLSADLQGEGLIHLNRLLLEDGYPDEIVKHWADVGPERGLALGPLDAPPEEAAPWQIYHAVLPPDETPIHQLRMEIEHPGDEGDPASFQLVIGHADDRGGFVPCLTVRADCAVIVHDNVDMEIQGQVIEGPIQADPSDPRFAAAVQESWVGGISTAADHMAAYYSGALKVTLLDLSAHPGERLQYTVSLRNNSQVNLTNIEVYEILTIFGEPNPQRLVASGLSLSPSGEHEQEVTSLPVPSGSGTVTVLVTALGDTPEGYRVQGAATEQATVDDSSIV